MTFHFYFIRLSAETHFLCHFTAPEPLGVTIPQAHEGSPPMGPATAKLPCQTGTSAMGQAAGTDILGGQKKN